MPQTSFLRLEVNIPPQGQRPTLRLWRNGDESTETDGSLKTGVIIEKVLIRASNLAILPKEDKKVPVRFGLHRVQLESVGVALAMKYDAELTNPKPFGEIITAQAVGLRQNNT